MRTRILIYTIPSITPNLEQITDEWILLNLKKEFLKVQVEQRARVLGMEACEARCR